MNALWFAHHVVSVPSLIALLAREAPRPGPNCARFNPQTLNRRILDAVEASASFRGFPLHQVRGAREQFEDSALRIAGRAPLVVAALAMLAREYLCEGRGQLRFRPAQHLEWRERWAGQTLLEPVRAAATYLTCLASDTGPLTARTLSPQDLITARDAHFLPSVADPDIDWLRHEGLAEVHRHDSLSKLTGRAYLHWLQNDPTKWPPGTASDELDWARSLRRLRALWRTLRTLVGPKCDASSDEDAWLALQRPGRPRNAERPIGMYPQLGQAVSPLWVDRGVLRDALCALAVSAPPFYLGVVFHAYILARHAIEMGLVHPPQGHRGLDRFKESFVDNPLQSQVTTDPAMRWRQAWNEGAVHWLEAKVGPGVRLSRQVDAWLGALSRELAISDSMRRGFPGRPPRAQALIATFGRPDEAVSRPAVRLVLHFIRKPDDVARAGRPLGPGFQVPRWARLREEVDRAADDLLRVLADRAIASLFVGLDVASYELAAPAEVFAPAFRTIRRSPLGAGLGVSVHAGEEFETLIGGMRSIDEHLRFLGLRAGDRIGHGLAAGLDPEHWRASSGSTAIQSRERRLDDLVWFAKRLELLPEYAHLFNYCQTEAGRLASALYGTPHLLADLHEAWLLRDIEPRGVCRPARVRVGAANAENAYGLDRLRHARPAAAEIWRRYSFDSNLKRAGREPIEVRLDPGFDDAVRQVQDMLCEEMADARVGVEVNPSSNLAIANLGSLTRHPVFRWFPVVRGAEARKQPRVCVGSDDPAIFQSELIHEYALLAEAARALGADPNDIRQWLRQLRQNGLEMRFGSC